MASVTSNFGSAASVISPSSHKRRTSVTNANFYDDGAISFLWTRHSFLVLFSVIIVLIYYALFLTEEDPIKCYKGAILFAVLYFVVVGVTQFNDGPFTRPHPAIWRLILAVSIVYEMFLVFLLFLTPEQGRKIFTYYDPKLGQPLPHETYADECTIYDSEAEDPWHSLRKKIDIFVIAHSLGWFVKALIFRDTWLCYIGSFLFEILEYTLTFQLPNFAECWWDHWILDFAGCNALGIYFGMKFSRWLEMREYRWRGFWNIDTFSGRVNRAVMQFSPYYWTSFRWAHTADLKHWITVVFITFFTLLMELNAFYLKFVLWVPANHHLNIYRLLIVSLPAAVAVREVYQYVNDKACVRFGQQAWILAFIASTEVLITIKYGRGQIPAQPDDFFWVYVWIAMFAGIISYTIFLVYVEFQRASVKSLKIE